MPAHSVIRAVVEAVRHKVSAHCGEIGSAAYVSELVNVEAMLTEC